MNAITRRQLVKNATAFAGATALCGLASPALAKGDWLAAPSTIDKVIDCDVVVLGMGLSGSAAAAFAGANGVSVVAIDPAISALGTNTVSLYGTAALETKDQLQYDNHVTKAEFFDYVYSNTLLQTNAQLLTSMIDVCGQAFDLMMDSGVKFNYQHLGDDENGLTIQQRMAIDYADSAPERAAQIQTMMDINNVQSLWSTAATSLIRDDDGAICGVYAQSSDGTVYQINSKGGVIIATGGFIWNKKGQGGL